MAATAETSPHSPRAAARGLPSPWANVVRREHDAAAGAPHSPTSIAQPSDRFSPDPAADGALGLLAPPSEGGEQVGGGGGNAGGGRGRKPAWSRPSNGSSESGPVMGAESWPTLSECTRASPKSSSSESLKALPDGSPSAPPGPVIASPPLKSITNTPIPNPITIHGPPARQKSMKHGCSSGSGGGTGGNLPANGGPVIPSPPPVPAHTPEPSHRNNSSNWDHSPRSGGISQQSHGGGEHHRSYGGSRRGSNGGGYGGRRDQERGGHDWNQPRGFSGKDIRMQPPPPRGVSRQFIAPPPPPSPPFMGPPPPIRPYMNPMGFPDMPSPVFYIPAPPEPPRGMPFVPTAVPPVMFVMPPDHRALLLKQIDYYFSPENLCKDIYLRQQMDDQGWVAISLIASFNRVKHLTNNIQYILDVVRASEVVEVQGDKIRKRNDWMNWVLPPSPNQYGTSGLQSPITPSHDTLATRVQNIVLEDGTTNHNITTGWTRHDIDLDRPGSGINQFQGSGPNGEWSGSAASRKESGRTNAARSLGRSGTL